MRMLQEEHNSLKEGKDKVGNELKQLNRKYKRK